MSYGSAADEEHVLSYAASKEPANGSSSTASVSSTAMTPTTAPSSKPPPPPPDPDGAFYNYPLIGLTGTNIDPSSSTAPTPSSTITARAQSYAVRTWATCRPWADFYSTSAISLPNFHALSDRMAANLAIYASNYHVVSAFWLALFFLFSIPTFLLALLFFFLLDRWAAKIAAKHGGKLSHKTVVFLVFASLVVVWVTGIAQQVISSLAFSFCSVLAHAALHEPVVIETEIANV